MSGDNLTASIAPDRRDHLSVGARSRAMALVHRKNTAPERTLRSALWRAGLRGWRSDFAGAPGRPDIAFTRWRVAVFVDGLLWHGHPSKYPARLDSRWRAKIERNVARDHAANAALRGTGWLVVRLWDREIRRDLASAVRRVEHAVAQSRIRTEQHAVDG